uniref:Uncharacterized protein n=1 Tax=Panagrolaimus sp. JU765 TaxID=591449 RepID=A0AC34QK81_9BILA
MNFERHILIIFLSCFWSLAIATVCQINNLQRFLPSNSLQFRSNPEWIFYGLTQDCQLFFARSDQLEQIKTLRVQNKVTYCLPNLVQIHWRQFHHHGIEGYQMGLQLLFKRANNQICTLPIEFPSKNALSGFTIFTYSLLSSLNYASCSYIANSSFVMEPDLSFMDSSFSDVIYFVDPESRSSFWNVRQFKFDKDGYFKALETFTVKNFAEDKSSSKVLAKDHVLALDGQRHKLLSIQRHNKNIASTCAYDLLFRPSKATIKKFNPLGHDSTQYRVNSFSVDGNLLLIGESFRQSHDQFLTKIFLTEKEKNDSAECILQLPFLTELSLVLMETKESLEKIHLPHFGHHKPRQKSHKIKNEQQTAVLQEPTTPTQPLFKIKPTSTTPKSLVLPMSTSTTRTLEKNDRKEEESDKKHEKESKNEENDVGDGRLLTEEEIREQKEQEDSNELGLMTEITTKNVLIQKEDQIEGSGDILPSTGLNKENLNSTANRSFFPVIVFFIFSVLFRQ